jgi:hypothetical protein
MVLMCKEELSVIVNAEQRSRNLAPTRLKHSHSLEHTSSTHRPRDPLCPATPDHSWPLTSPTAWTTR